MNAKDVYREVSAMISEGYIESEGALCTSLNRALAEIGHLYPRKQFVTLRHFGLPAVFRLPSPREVMKESPLTVSALSCEGFCCKGSGKGEVLITSNGKLLHREGLDGLPFSFNRTLFSLGADSGAEITLLFRSDSCLLLEELVLYEKLGSADIPNGGEYVRYGMASLLPSFVSFSGECRKNGLPISADGGELILDTDSVRIVSDASGVYEIGCYGAPRTVTEENEGEVLDLSAELLYLVPLLTAYYACLEAEDARADAFLARYEKARKDFRHTFRFAVNDTVEDVRGW